MFCGPVPYDNEAVDCPCDTGPHSPRTCSAILSLIIRKQSTAHVTQGPRTCSAVLSLMTTKQSTAHVTGPQGPRTCPAVPSFITRKQSTAHVTQAHRIPAHVLRSCPLYMTRKHAHSTGPQGTTLSEKLWG